MSSSFLLLPTASSLYFTVFLYDFILLFSCMISLHFDKDMACFANLESSNILRVYTSTFSAEIALYYRENASSTCLLLKIGGLLILRGYIFFSLT